MQMLSPAGLSLVPMLQATIAAIHDGEAPLLLTPPQLFRSEYVQQRCFARQRKLEGRGFVVVATERSRLLFEGRVQEIRYVEQCQRDCFKAGFAHVTRLRPVSRRTGFVPTKRACWRE
jgi:hypothetical protein